MDAPLRTPYVNEVDDCFLRIARQSIVIAAVLLVSLSILTCIRGLSGVYQAPDSTLAQLLPVIVALSFASLFRVLWQRLHPDASALHQTVSRLAIPSACICCVAIALSTSGLSFVSFFVLWVAVVSSELAWWYPTLRAQTEPTLSPRQSLETREEAQLAGDSCDMEDELDPNITQQLTRSTNDDSIEVITGILRANFTAGERTRNLHVAFCPPLDYQPSVTVHQLDGKALTAKVAQSESFGARIELRLEASAKQGETAAIYFDVQPRH